MIEAVADAWRIAGVDLGVEVIAPFELVDDQTQHKVSCIAFIRWFGSPSGTVVLGRHSPSELARAAAEARGIFFSVVDERSFAKYDRNLFTDTLNDWGWYGAEGGAPGWFNGEPWTT